VLPVAVSYHPFVPRNVAFITATIISKNGRSYNNGDSSRPCRPSASLRTDAEPVEVPFLRLQAAHIRLSNFLRVLPLGKPFGASVGFTSGIDRGGYLYLTHPTLRASRLGRASPAKIAGFLTLNLYFY
jgi:hypothetical protein